MLELVRRGIKGTGVDVSIAMCAYNNFLAHVEKLAVTDILDGHSEIEVEWKIADAPRCWS